MIEDVRRVGEEGLERRLVEPLVHHQHLGPVAVEAQACILIRRGPAVCRHAVCRPFQAVSLRRAHEAQAPHVRPTHTGLHEMEARLPTRDDEEVASRAEQSAGVEVHRAVIGGERRERRILVDAESPVHILVPVLGLPPVGRRLERAGHELDRASGRDVGVDPVETVEMWPDLRQRGFGEALEHVAGLEGAEAGERDRSGKDRSRTGPLRCANGRSWTARL